MYRRLAPEERLYLALTQQLTFTFALTARICGHFTPDDVRVAIAAVKRRHPLLNVRVDHTKWMRPSFASDNRAEIPLRVIEDGQDDTWVGVVAGELIQPFSFGRGPLVRCVLVRAPAFADLLVVCDHLIADGLSALYFIRDVLAVLGNRDSPVEVLPLMPALSALLPAKVVPLSAAAYRPHPPARLPSGRKTVKGDARPVVLPWSLTATETAALNARCRREHTTVHAAVAAAFARAFADLDPTTAVRMIGSSISLRDRLVQPVGEGVGVYAALVHTRVDASPEHDFWEVARRSRQDLRREVAAKSFGLDRKVMTVVSRIPHALLRWLVTVAVAKPSDDIIIANLGRVPLPRQNGTVWLESLYGVANPVATNHRFLGVIALGDRLYFVLTLRDAEFAMQLKDQAMLQLRGAIWEAQTQANGIEALS